MKDFWKRKKKLVRKNFEKSFQLGVSTKSFAHNSREKNLPASCKLADRLHHHSTQVAFSLSVLKCWIQRMPEDVLYFIGMHNAHPLTPQRSASSLQRRKREEKVWIKSSPGNQVLQGFFLSPFSIEKKFAWIWRRESFYFSPFP